METIARELTLNNSFYTHELPVIIQKIKNDCAWNMGDLKSEVIVNEPDNQVVLTALHAQTEIKSQQKGKWVNFHVLEGSLKVSIRKDSIILAKGQKFTLYDKTKYILESLTETFFLLTIHP